MAHEKLRPEYVFDEEKIAQLKQLAPECFEDGKINFTTLSQNLGDWRQDEEDPELEHFGLFWPGKRDARKAAAIPPEGTLEPVWGDGLKADGTPDTDGVNDSKNIFIEGENLEVLKLLQKSYAGKIKMIYIDPPYNTGNDFVYDDDFTEPLQEYLRRTGQVDEEGRAMTTNKRSDGRFHSKWLSMMYPRLRLARNLLREDGVIFVSIDDNEVHNLRAIMNEIFGEENFIAELIWKRRSSSALAERNVSSDHEYVLCFNKSLFDSFKGLEKDFKNFKNPDNDPNGEYVLGDLTVGMTAAMRPNQAYDLVDKITGNIFPFNPNRVWSFIPSSMQKMIEDGKVFFPNDVSKRPMQKRYKKDLIDSSNPFSSLMTQVGLNTEATRQIQDILGGRVFEYSKPLSLLKTLIDQVVNENDIVLDFFAGSNSTGHAVIDYSVENDKSIKFITIQLPEILNEKSEAYSAGFKRVSDISLKRLKNACSKLDNKVGFRSFKMVSTNFKIWRNFQSNSILELENQLELFNQSPLKESFNKDSLLAEIALLEGFTLCSTISQLTEVQSNTIRKVTSEYCDHALLVCLDNQIAKATVAGLQLGENDIFICLDSAISTEDKLRLSDKGLIKTI